jgi:two-component system CheB/CheR fusion protein
MPMASSRYSERDFGSVIDATDIGTIVLDRSLRIALSTGLAREVFNVLPSDVGRPVAEIASSLIDDRLHADLREVLERRQPIEREIETREGQRYLLRIIPYPTADGNADGVVITLVNISAIREAERRVTASEERLRLLIDSAVDYAIFTMTTDGVVDSWNPGAERMFGYTSDEIVGRSAAILFTEDDRESRVFDEEIRCAIEEGRAADERYHQRRDGTRFYCSGVTIRLGEGAALGFAKIARDLTPQRESEIALQNAHNSLEQRVNDRTRELQDEVRRRTAAQEHIASLVRKLVTAQEEQRARIARDLHDQVGQQMTALRLTLDRCADRGAASAVGADLQRAVALARDIDSELDFLAWELRPAVLDDHGLLAALPRFIDDWSYHHQVVAEFHVSGFTNHHLTPEAEVTFYRITQEALNNVIKHAQATRVDVMLKSRDGLVTLIIEDNGIGFDPSDRDAATRGIGIAGMRERAALSLAALEIESAPGKGTTLFLRAPIAAQTGDPRP